MSSRRALTALCLLVVLSLAAPRLAVWVDPMARLAETLVAPSQSVIRAVFLPRAERLIDTDPNPAVAGLEAQTQQLRTLLRRSEQRVRELERLIEQLQQGRLLNQFTGVNQLDAAVIGLHANLSTSLLKVLAGTRTGVGPGSVAVFDGVNVVGRVVDSDERLCRVLPITDRQAGRLRGVVLTAERLTPESDPLGRRVRVGPAEGQRLSVILEPNGRGVLTGSVEYPPIQAGETLEDRARREQAVEPGMLVRLSDPSWPRSAQMLVLGVIERAERLDNDRRRVTVRPLADLERLSEVSLRVPVDALADAPEQGVPGAGAPR
ncbi:MAG: hypothetical protein C0475_03420 [Planctomyces sp.]|nr:hypothetical protein [Planctomyces sp.]